MAHPRIVRGAGLFPVVSIENLSSEMNLRTIELFQLDFFELQERANPNQYVLAMRQVRSASLYVSGTRFQNILKLQKVRASVLPS